MPVTFNPRQQNQTNFPLNRSQRTLSFLENAVPQAVRYAEQGMAASQAASLAGTSGAAASRAFSTTATGSMMAGISRIASGALNILGAAQGGWDLISRWGKSTPAQGAMSGAALGAGIGSFFGPVGTGIGAAVGTIAGGLIGMIKTGKHKDQIARDQVRDMLVQQGFIGEDHKLKLADGSTFHIGKDGGAKTAWGSRMYEVDFNQPFAAQTVSWMNPLADLLCGSNEKLKNDFCGYFTNAAMSNARSPEDIAKNVASIMGQFGLDAESLAQGIRRGVQEGRFERNIGAVYLQGIQEWSDLSQQNFSKSAENNLP